MTPEYTYFLKVNIAIAIFYAFYRLFFYKDTFFQWRRSALLCFLAISAFYPLLNIQGWVKEQEPMVVMVDLYSTVMLPDIVTGTTQATDWQQFFHSSFLYVYIGIVCLLFLHFLIQLIGIFRLSMRTPTTSINNIHIHILDKPQGPFSFFNCIFINPLTHSEEELEEILTHENTHVSQWHSMDVIVSEIACILCWFNPFIWLLKREVRNNLEFLADHNVLETGHDSRKYQYHLLGLTYEKKVATLYNSFNVLPLKNRIKMMNKKRTKRIGRTKYLLFIPLATLLLIVSNIEALARSTKNMIPDFTTSSQQEKLFRYKGTVVNDDNKLLAGAQIVIEGTNQPIAVTNHVGSFSFEWKKEVAFTVIYRASNNIVAIEHVTSNSEKKDRENMVIVIRKTPVFSPEEETEQNGDVVFEVVDQMPAFPGGNGALLQFLAKNTIYPENAKKNSIQGRVIAQFIVDKEGNISNVQIVRSVDPELDAEAIRILKELPKWIPGKQRGKNVAVRYTVPVMFRL